MAKTAAAPLAAARDHQLAAFKEMPIWLRNSLCTLQASNAEAEWGTMFMTTIHAITALHEVAIFFG